MIGNTSVITEAWSAVTVGLRLDCKLWQCFSKLQCSGFVHLPGGVVGGAGNKSHLFIVNIGVCEVGSSGEGTFSGSNLADFFPFCSTSGARRRMFSS